METKDRFRQRLVDLFGSQKLASLSTQNGGQPYASLVAFHAANDGRHLYFVTPKTTRKFANLSADGRVALMINNSTNTDADFHEAISVTAVGTADEITGSEKQNVLSQYLSKHPYLEEFARAKTCALVGVRVASYFMVRNFQIVTELHIQS
jgi:nitroimidazol reductase NimA-like FMN-containing flavoprotein (pyridoxamine 5'-phosphate oxidase superfamily)